MVTKLRTFVANVTAKDETTLSARIIVQTYRKGLDQVALAFSVKMSSFDDSAIQTPPGDEPFSFRQQMRLCREGATTYQGPRQQELDFIRQKLKEAYGELAEVEVQEIER